MPFVSSGTACRVEILEIPADVPADLQTALVQSLPAATQTRLAAFNHPARRTQTLWGRLLANRAAQKAQMHLKEEPPYSPYMHSPGGTTRALSIAHTARTVALGVSTRTSPIIGLDAETVRPLKNPEGMCRYAFDEAVADYLLSLKDSDAFESTFFALWGYKEAAIKLNRGGHERYRLQMQLGRPVVIDTLSGTALKSTHRIRHGVSLSVLTQKTAPLFVYVNAQSLIDSL